MALIPLALGLVVAHANVLTMDPSHPNATHVAIADGRIAYVGDDLASARAAAGPGARELDAHGATVAPGFNDAHVHFGLSLTIGAEEAIDFGEAPRDRATFERAIRIAAARKVPRDAHDWVLVVTRALPAGVEVGSDLPSIDRPLLVVTERGGILNERARRRVSLRRGDVPRGIVGGRMLPALLDRIIKSLPKTVLENGARAFLAKAARLGITSMQLMDELPDLFDALRRSGELTARIRMMVFGLRFETPRYAPTWKSPDPSVLVVDGVKYFDDDWARLPRDELGHIYEEALAAKRQVILHVLSRGALRSLLDELERLESRLPGGARLFRVDHADRVPPELADRLRRLDMTVCETPSMLPEWRSDRAFPMRTLLDHGVTTCIGSDFVGKHSPARPLDPLFSSQMAVTHGGYGDVERITFAEALRAATVGAAIAEGRTDRGMIRVGQDGDLVGLGRDPSQVPPSEIVDVPVRFTVLAGRVVYEAPLQPAIPTVTK